MRIAAGALVIVLTAASITPANAAAWEEVIGTGSFSGCGALESEWNYRYR